jgi:hypothetical protein
MCGVPPVDDSELSPDRYGNRRRAGAIPLTGLAVRLDPGRRGPKDKRPTSVNYADR